MQIKTIQIILDDNGREVRSGDTVLVQTKQMEDPVQATVGEIMTTMVTFLIDDRSLGYGRLKVRAQDVQELTFIRSGKKEAGR